MTLPDDRMKLPDDRITTRHAIAQCAVGDTLCHVYVLSEAQWEAMAPGNRPATAEHFPGLGWVVATPGRPK